jgi:hypothetical protein
VRATRPIDVTGADVRFAGTGGRGFGDDARFDPARAERACTPSSLATRVTVLRATRRRFAISANE